MKVFVDPACNINYGSFYVKGLWDHFGKSNVRFTSKYFKDLQYSAQTHCMAFVIDGIRYVIDWADSNEVFYENFLEWADVYGKVNYKINCLPKIHYDKIKRIAPNFGIGYFGRNKSQALMNCLKNYRKCFNRLEDGLLCYLSPYLWLYKRSKIDLRPSVSTVGSRLIFMVSRYWQGETETNNARIAFIRACKRLKADGLIDFIGGMVPENAMNDCPEDVLIQEEIPMDKYVRFLEKSLLVFNTPAVHQCHGWKLPEYLAHGKIILSTPFVNELPTDMIHAENIYFSEADEESLYTSIKKIVSNIDLQKNLENGSREYWENYASPKACIKKFING